METILAISTRNILDELRQNEALETLSAEAEDNYVSVCLRTLEQELDDFANLSSKIHEESTADDAMRVLISFQGAESTAQLLDSHLDTLMMTSGSTNKQAIALGKSWVSGKLIPWLKSMWGSVWATVSRLITPIEWKIKGGLNTSFLGLANVEVEVTFGRPSAGSGNIP